MTWRYIACKEIQTGEIIWTVRELYEDGTGEQMWTENPISAVGNSWKDLRRDLARMSADTGLEKILDLTADPPMVRKRTSGDSEPID